MTVADWVAFGVFLTVLGGLATAWSLVQAWQLDAPIGPRTAVLPVVRDTRAARMLGALATPTDPEERAGLEVFLLQAGHRARGAVGFYLAARTVLAVVMPFPLWWALAPTSGIGRVVVVVLGAAFGYYLPAVVVALQRRARQHRLARAVPDMLDMLVSCVEAGLGIDIALRRVAGEIGVASPELAEELALVNAELTAGIPRANALAELERRTGVDDLAALVNVLGMVERYGSGIAQSLRAHAQLSRRRRALRAEQRAARASPALTVAMVLFILPVLFVVLLGPAIVHVVNWLFPNVAGGLL